ncbi:hypothetical protein [Streptomyces sp. GZWMJZ-114]|uniref:hypothetical protein n=1 Tax=Streptomyces sp. GZWMJZ-114 TaxID=2494734 RepID=UPI00101059FB|nr:hypothetical protein [Streptomyces sp. GZWMJZ-114]
MSVNQYSDACVRASSSLSRVGGSPPRSVQARYFSTIRASSPAGESARAGLGVSGRVLCSCRQPP